MSVFDDEFLDEQIAAQKTLITNLRAAINALTTGGQQMYQLDNGQHRVMVQRSQLSQLRIALSDAMNELSALDIRKCGAGSSGRPSW